MPDRELRPMVPAPSQTGESATSILLDLLEQMKDLSLKVGAGDLIRGQLLEKMNAIETNTREVPMILFRIQELEKHKDKAETEISKNREFRIRQETSQASRRWTLGLFAGAIGAMLAAIFNAMLHKMGF